MNLDDIPDETCGWCRKHFSTTNIAQKFCCAACRKASDIHFWTGIRKEERRRKNACKTCPVCETRFDANHGLRLYCSERCRVVAGIRAQTSKIAQNRKERIAALACQQCGSPINNAVKSSRKFCDQCKLNRARDKMRAQRCKRYEARQREIFVPKSAS